MSHLKYRPDIDGLRALAVLGVVIYHAFPSILPGGFVGVDIFFVISGYLISGILYKGHLQQNFSFKEFYARRIKRLFPSLITVLVLCMGYGWLVLLPDEYAQLGRHVAAGSLFIQNFVFWQESGYFDTAAHLKPLLHLWSLAVEEQFYIFFPLLLMLLWKIKLKWSLVCFMVLLLIVSLIGNLVMSVQNEASDFFLTPYRAWEFLGGSLLAWWHFDRGHEADVPQYRNALSVFGLLLLLLGMGFIHQGVPFPGWRALLPVVGTLMLIEGGKKAWVNEKIFSYPIVVWIGLISYPLYLFHWPALSFLHIINGNTPALGAISAALGISLVLTVLTYYFIEKPIRFSGSSVVQPLLIIFFFITGIFGVLIWTGAVSNHNGQKVAKVTSALKDSNIRLGLRTLEGTRWVQVKKIGGEGPQTVFLGDSNMQQYTARITKLLTDNGSANRSAYFITVGGVIPVKGVTNKSFKGNSELLSSFWNAINTNPKIDRVVIAAHWFGYFQRESGYSYHGVSLGSDSTKEEVLTELGKTIRTLCQKSIKVFLVLSVPSGQELSPDDYLKRSYTGIQLKEPKGLTLDEVIRREGWLRLRLAEIARANGATVIDPLPYLTTNGECIIQNQDGPIRYNSCHLRPSFVKDYVKYLDCTVAP